MCAVQLVDTFALCIFNVFEGDSNNNKDDKEEERVMNNAIDWHDDFRVDTIADFISLYK